MERVAKRQEIDWNMVVADNIRAELSRERWSNRQAAMALGVTPNWVNRRMSGETRLDPDDIVVFAKFLNVSVAELFVVKPKSGPSPEGNGPRVLPEMDSNHQPAVISLASYRRAKTSTNTSQWGRIAPVIPFVAALG